MISNTKSNKFVMQMEGVAPMRNILNKLDPSSKNATVMTQEEKEERKTFTMGCMKRYNELYGPKSLKALGEPDSCNETYEQLYGSLPLSPDDAGGKKRQAYQQLKILLGVVYETILDNHMAELYYNQSARQYFITSLQDILGACPLLEKMNKKIDTYPQVYASTFAPIKQALMLGKPAQRKAALAEIENDLGQVKEFRAYATLAIKSNEVDTQHPVDDFLIKLAQCEELLGIAAVTPDSTARKDIQETAILITHNISKSITNTLGIDLKGINTINGIINAVLATQAQQMQQTLAPPQMAANLVKPSQNANTKQQPAITPMMQNHQIKSLRLSATKQDPQALLTNMSSTIHALPYYPTTKNNSQIDQIFALLNATAYAYRNNFEYSSHDAHGDAKLQEGKDALYINIKTMLHAFTETKLADKLTPVAKKDAFDTISELIDTYLSLCKANTKANIKVNTEDKKNIVELYSMIQEFSIVRDKDTQVTSTANHMDVETTKNTANNNMDIETATGNASKKSNIEFVIPHIRRPSETPHIQKKPTKPTVSIKGYAREITSQLQKFIGEHFVTEISALQKEVELILKKEKEALLAKEKSLAKEEPPAKTSANKPM